MRSINIQFPLVDDPEKNKLFRMNNVTKDALKSDLMLLLLTDKGERYMMPNYGTDLRKFIFEPNDTITIGDVEEDIRNTVKNYIPELTIANLDILTINSPGGEDLGENEIRVTINFNYDEGVFSETGRVDIIY